VAAIAATDADKSVSLLGLLEDLDEAPALGSAHRAGLHHAYPVTNGGTVLLIVCLEPAGLTQHLAIQTVLDPILDRNHNGLVHLVADDVALADLTSAPLCGGRISASAVINGP